jgi:uncharacterized membrane protein YcaP (DUF421 family)
MFELPIALEIIARGVSLTAASLFWILLLVRIVGLRSFSKMTAFDFVATIATGSLLATAATSTSWGGFSQASIAVVALMAIQAMLASLRKASPSVRRTLGNTPVLLMRDGEFLDDALRRTRVAREDVMAKIRAANVLDVCNVRAVVLENTGDISILHGRTLNEDLLRGVQGSDIGTV